MRLSSSTEMDKQVTKTINLLLLDKKIQHIESNDGP